MRRVQWNFVQAGAGKSPPPTVRCMTRRPRAEVSRASRGPGAKVQAASGMAAETEMGNGHGRGLRAYVHTLLPPPCRQGCLYQSIAFGPPHVRPDLWSNHACAAKHPPDVCPSCRPFSTTSAHSASTVAQQKRKHDPYFRAQARARKAANLSRQEVLRQQRAETLGDPVRGVTTPFVRSFDTGAPPAKAAHRASTGLRVDYSDQEVEWEDAIRVPQTSADGGRSEDAALFKGKPEPLNYFLDSAELRDSIERSKYLTTPPDTDGDSIEDFLDVRDAGQREADRQADQANADEAIRRIAALSLGNSKDRMRVNVSRCIETFGRHNTDRFLTRVANPDQTIAEASAAVADAPSVMPRMGQDTGSSEVQIAILTAKIRTLSDFLQTRGMGDKVNKRNLRLLVHRRQKLLQYLRRKDRGGSRWAHCVNTLGLTEGTWKGEISL